MARVSSGGAQKDLRPGNKSAKRVTRQSGIKPGSGTIDAKVQHQKGSGTGRINSTAQRKGTS